MTGCVDFVAFGVIIDDIVYPDGETKMGVLGGGGPQTAFGMRLWSKNVGLVAGIGGDLSSMVESWLRSSEIDAAGLRISEHRTPRAWQLLEYDERRTQVWRVPERVIALQLGKSLGYLPEDYRNARGFHYGIHPDEPDYAFLEGLHELGAVVSIEPFKPADRKPASGTLRKLLSQIDIFSTNVLEAESLVDGVDPGELSLRLMDAGAGLVVIRLGSAGSLISDRRTGSMIQVPAVPVDVINPIGAGNAYCGGFLVGWIESQDLSTAGVYGSVAASFLVEDTGVPECNQQIQRESQCRAEALAQQVVFVQS